MSEPLIRILEKWKGRNKVFVFDLLPENFDINDHEAIYRRRNSWNITAFYDKEDILSEKLEGLSFLNAQLDMDKDKDFIKE